MGVLPFSRCRAQIRTSHIGGVATQDTFRGRTAVEQRFVTDSPGGSRDALAERRSALSRDLLGTDGGGTKTSKVKTRRKPARKEPRAQNVRAKRQVPELALGIVLVVGGALGAAWMAKGGNETVTIVAAARELDAGHVVGPSDLVAKNVQRDTASYFVGASDAKVLVGRALRAPVALGAPLGLNILSELRPLKDGEILSSFTLEAGDFPPELSPGDIVRVALSPDPSVAAKAEPQEYDGTVEVWDLQAPTDSELSYVVTLRTGNDFLLPSAGATKIKIAILPATREAP